MILWYYTIWYGIIYHVIWYNIISWYYIICYFTYWYDIVSNNDNVSYDTICSHMKWYCIMIRYIFLKRSCIIYDISFDIVSYNFVFYDITLFWYKRSATMISCIMIKMVLWRSCLVSVSFVISDYLCLIIHRKKATKTFAFVADYVNAMDSPIVFQCGSGVIHGIESYHQDTYEDRRFKFKCCNLPRK